MSEKIKKTIRNILLIFVFVSIGFAFGKHCTDVKSMTKKTGDASETIYVYYMHGTVRCKTCNTIERMTKELLEKKFAEEMKNKEIIFLEINFQENEDLSKKFDVISSCVVVALKKAGKITDYKRLDEVWTLMSKPVEFDEYISKAILGFQREQAGGK